MKNGWTGGQYSLCRALFGVYLFVRFTALLPWAGETFSNRGVLLGATGSFLYLFPNVLALTDSPIVVVSLIVVAAVASICFSAGLYDRTAALVVLYALACLFGRNPITANPALPFVGGLLLWHVCLPPSPYGSWSARARIDPRGGWSVPRWLFAAAWMAMSVGYSYSGYTKLVSPPWVGRTPLAGWAALGLELAYAPLALFRRARPRIWVAMMGLHLGLPVLADFSELSLGMVLVHLFTFDPNWVPSRWSERRDILFYDGTCGLCHGATRFVLSEDRRGTAFTYAPLQGDTFAGMIANNERSALPDSVIVRTEAGELLTRSDAVIYILQRLGGLWRVIGVTLQVIPQGLRNRAYDFVASVRYRLFARARTVCPILPPDLRARFQA
jgi:predicted DCC family thiol-disulfide oxidoreductase YuxK